MAGQLRHRRRRAVCHADRPYYARDLCRQCYDAGKRRARGQAELPRTTCPGCHRDDVVLLAPLPASASRGRAARPWRRKAHAIAGDLQQADAERCHWPTDLTPEEQPQEEP